MEDQFFSNNAPGQLFDLSLSNSSPMGFSPSIDITNGLPLTFGDALETPSFMIEVQRKRADTVTTLKPGFQLDNDAQLDNTGIIDDLPKRPRAIQRLSLTPSVASSAASTTASEYDYNGFESDADNSAAPSPANEDNFGTWTAATFAAASKMPDLIHSRSHMTIQAAFDRIGFHSPSASSTGLDLPDEHQITSDLNFNEFIEDPTHTAETEQLGTGLVSDSSRPSLPSSVSFDSVSSSASSDVFSPQTPQSSVNSSHGHAASGTGAAGSVPVHGRFYGSESSLGLFGANPVPISGMPLHAPVFGASMMAPGEASHPEMYYAGQPMVFSQSVPAGHAMAMYGSPCPSSPSSVRSSSPYPGHSFNGTMPSVLNSPTSNQIHIQHIPVQAPGTNMLPKGMSLFNHFAHLANPYAGLITKRSRGRRVPNKPEEMNNLGKSGKVYTCKVPGCGKCFKRSEHLKRHVRSIHTDDKPFLCPYPSCNKRFSRHDNLNQHARVHTSTAGGPVRPDEAYPVHGMHPMSHMGMPLAHPHPMVLTAAPQGGISITPVQGEQQQHSQQQLKHND
ncbi:hypothetical protein BCV70DRAFT_159106 [Testicularia cyperi]|uniref:C2H2-type domain-containing protein n=1 Tax=Testicularia cyperi TaxID=1882483 RepID=A0A317XSX9_9BASI|nr:hypothetical protein BCV70DRAFT_159106 [Testicularia cyperi]